MLCQSTGSGREKRSVADQPPHTAIRAFNLCPSVSLARYKYCLLSHRKRPSVSWQNPHHNSASSLHYLVVLSGFTLQRGGHVQTDGLNPAEQSRFRPVLDHPFHLQCQLLVILDCDGLCRVPGGRWQGKLENQYQNEHSQLKASFLPTNTPVLFADHRLKR